MLEIDWSSFFLGMVWGAGFTILAYLATTFTEYREDGDVSDDTPQTNP